MSRSTSGSDSSVIRTASKVKRRSRTPEKKEPKQLSSWKPVGDGQQPPVNSAVNAPSGGPSDSKSATRWDDSIPLPPQPAQPPPPAEKGDAGTAEGQPKPPEGGNLTELESFLKDLKQNKKQQWIQEGKVKE